MSVSDLDRPGISGETFTIALDGTRFTTNPILQVGPGIREQLANGSPVYDGTLTEDQFMGYMSDWIAEGKFQCVLSPGVRKAIQKRLTYYGQRERARRSRRNKRRRG